MTGARTTLDAVAAAAGVSRMTVSNVYSRPEVVAAATRDRVLAAAAEIGYGGPSPVGRTLRRGSTQVLGILVNVGISYTFSDPGAAEFMRGVAHGADEADLSLQIVHAAGATARSRVNDAAVDAFIAWSLPADDPGLTAAIDRRIPIVAFGGASGVEGIPCVSADNFGGARAAARHLIDLGIRHLAVVDCQLERDEFRDRFAGWQDALATAGIGWEAVVRLEQPTNSRAAGRAAADAFLQIRAHTDDPGERWGILTLTDVLALGVLHRMREADIDVPGAIAVVGFDDIDEAAASTPGLTTVHQQLFELGRECALRAAGRIDGPTAPSPTWLVVRGSTDQAAARPTRVGST